MEIRWLTRIRSLDRWVGWFSWWWRWWSDSKCCWCDRQTEPGKDRTSLLVSSGDGAPEAPGTLVPALWRNPRRGLQG
jgi:hypothetical protein